MSQLTKSRRQVDVVVNLSLCRSCDLCVKFCPEDVLVSRPPLFKAEVARLEQCTGCRMCEFLCPDWAILVDVTSPAAA
jgi:Pyruvate/2-oxoacid:ferredoxin oxidoreductase delta subunit